MSNFQDLPDELILKVLSYSKIKALITCGQASKRIRKISRDNSLWMTVTLEKKIVKTELLELILGKGCTILRISNSTILGSLSSNIKSQLRVLNMSHPVAWNCIQRPLNIDVSEKLLFSSCSIQHLAMNGVRLTPKMAQSICRNDKTLQILNLNYSSVIEISNPFGDELSYLEEIFKCCQELKEVNFNEVRGLCDSDLEDLVNNIPPTIEKLILSRLNLTHRHVEILLSRCNKIKALSLPGMWQPNVALKNIRQYLNHDLEELSLTANKNISGSGILELKSMPRLKRLYLLFKGDFKEEQMQGLGMACQNLKQHLPHLRIKMFFH